MGRRFIRTCILVGIVALMALIITGGGRLQGQSVDTELSSGDLNQSFSFRLEIAGHDVGTYDECHGLGSSNDIEESVIQTLGGVSLRQKTPGPLEWHQITLERIEPSDVAVWSWRKAMEDGDFENAITDGAITLWRTDPVEPLVRWEFRNGWIASLSFDGFTETMTIVHEGLVRAGTTTPSGLPGTRRSLPGK